MIRIGVPESARFAMAVTIYARKVWRTSLAAVSIGSRGRIYFNAPTARLLHVNGAEWAPLEFDRAQRKIAVRPLNKRDKRAFRINYVPNFSQAAVCAKSFLLQLGWDKRRYQVEAQWDEQKSLLEFKMPWARSDRIELLPLETWRRKAR
jgi:hypothetical protein